MLYYEFAGFVEKKSNSKPINGLHLRSDHRAVQSCLLLPSEGQQRRKRTRKQKIDWTQFQEVAKEYSCDPCGGLQNFEKKLQALAHLYDDKEKDEFSRSWDSPELQHLRAMRRGTQDAEERKRISKQIWRKTRDQLRHHKIKQAEAKLKEFSKLESLGK